MMRNVTIADDVLIVDPNSGKKGSAFATVLGFTLYDHEIVVEGERGREVFHWLEFKHESAQGKPWLRRDRWIVVVPPE